MQGIRYFRTLEEAARAGFNLYDSTPAGYIVRGGTPGGLALALVRTKRP